MATPTDKQKAAFYTSLNGKSLADIVKELVESGARQHVIDGISQFSNIGQLVYSDHEELPYWLMSYCYQVRKQIWIEAEPFIKQNSSMWFAYWTLFLEDYATTKQYDWFPIDGKKHLSKKGDHDYNVLMCMIPGNEFPHCAEYYELYK